MINLNKYNKNIFWVSLSLSVLQVILIIAMIFVRFSNILIVIIVTIMFIISSLLVYIIYRLLLDILYGKEEISKLLTNDTLHKGTTKFFYKENEHVYNKFGTLLIQKNIANKNYNDLKDLFFKLIPEELYKNVGERGEDRVNLGLASKKDLTIMFLDIIGFSKIAEEMSSDQTLGLLNTYFSGILTIIKENNGYVDKFLGDGMMIIFDGETVKNAIITAIEIQKFIIKEQYNLKETHIITLGIGINKGDVTIGTVGGYNRMEITIIGDIVNTASRLEGLTRTTKENILIGEKVYNSIIKKSDFQISDLGLRKLRGKNKEIHIYGIVGYNLKKGRK